MAGQLGKNSWQCLWPGQWVKTAWQLTMLVARRLACIVRTGAYRCDRAACPLSRELEKWRRQFAIWARPVSFEVLLFWKEQFFWNFTATYREMINKIPEFFREVLAWNARLRVRACVYIWCMSTWDSKVTRHALVKLPTRAVEWVASPGELATKGVHAPREAMHEWMLAPVPENQNVLFIFWSTLNLLTRKCWN